MYFQVALAAASRASNPATEVGKALKRKSISFEGGDQVKKSNVSASVGNKKRPMGNNKVYAPPQGKYSANLGHVGKYLLSTQSTSDIRKTFYTSFLRITLRIRLDTDSYS